MKGHDEEMGTREASESDGGDEEARAGGAAEPRSSLLSLLRYFASWKKKEHPAALDRVQAQASVREAADSASVTPGEVAQERRKEELIMSRIENSNPSAAVPQDSAHSSGAEAPDRDSAQRAAPDVPATPEPEERAEFAGEGSSQDPGMVEITPELSPANQIGAELRSAQDRVTLTPPGVCPQDAYEFSRNLASVLTEWALRALCTGLRSEAVRVNEEFADAGAEIRQAFAERPQELLSFHRCLHTLMGDTYRWLRSHRAALDEEAFLRAFHDSGEEEELFRIVRGSVRALGGLERVNLADLTAQAAETSRAAVDRWQALRRDLSENVASLKAAISQFDAQPVPRPTAESLQQASSLEALTRLAVGEVQDLAQLERFRRDPAGQLLEPMVRAVLDQAVCLLPEPEQLLPGSLALLESLGALQHETGRSQTEIDRFTEDLKRMLKLLVAQLNSIEGLESTFETVEQFYEHAGEESSAIRFSRRLAATYRELVQRLNTDLPTIGLERLRPAKGEEVDWAFHHPTETHDVVNGPEGVIDEVLQSGYRFLPTGEVLQMVDVVLTRKVAAASVDAPGAKVVDADPGEPGARGPEQAAPATESSVLDEMKDRGAAEWLPADPDESA